MACARALSRDLLRPCGRSPAFTSRASCVPKRSVAAMATHEKHVDDQVIDLINLQLERYNARDLDPFMEVFSEDVKVYDQITGTLLADGKAALRPRYVERFKTPVHCELIGRLALGSVVVDREIITGLPNDGVAECMATYTVDTSVRPMKIKNIQFVWKPRTFGVKMH